MSRKPLTYANVMSSLAVFLLLGGGAYAATQLPANSVGRAQLKEGSVTRSKLARRAVGRSRLGLGAVTIGKLSPSVRSRLGRIPPTGPVGPAGPAGSRGPQGAPGPSAARIDFSAPIVAPETLPVPLTTVLNDSGLQLRTACISDLDGTPGKLLVGLAATETSQGIMSIAYDTGTDPSTGTAETVHNAFTFPAGTLVDLGGLGTAGNGAYARAVVTLIVTAPRRTTTISMTWFATNTTRRCSMTGTAVTAT